MRDTPQWRLDALARYLDKAVTQLKHSTTLTEKPTMSFAALIRASHLRGDADAATGWLREAIKRDPYCVRPRTAHMNFLEPRWGGSYSAIQQFADDAAREDHPKLKEAAKSYKAWIPLYRGMELDWANDRVAALDAFNKALGISETDMILLRRAWLYRKVGQRELALADIERVLKLKPRHPDALYLRGLLFDKPIDQALQHLRIAADLGNGHAMNDPGYLYPSGKYGVAPNVEEGIAWWKKSAYFGDSFAANHLGGIYAEGRGVPVNHAEAVKYFRVAASGGDAKAMNELGLLLWYGKGAPASHEEAIDLWVKGAEKGLGQSWHNLRSLLRPAELAMVLVRHPYLVLHEGTRLWYPVAFIALLLLVTALIIVRLQRGAARA